ncbi:hypothetical protein EG346_14890 [Chryseobacterium carnipullorum]|uniref:Uncharacterized protein n=1 Tax=Chryseobacterium carnipullorum TaxID=1124835 RepID=A0A3G6N8G6_CHRCU|nr:hypothetical protein EG346_14890 [Chryseobacterium carnipullorum]AZA64272.1 hypothetical protein EG345_05825 [Chryseobacterium carnipullorum]
MVLAIGYTVEQYNRICCNGKEKTGDREMKTSDNAPLAKAFWLSPKSINECEQRLAPAWEFIMLKTIRRDSCGGVIWLEYYCCIFATYYSIFV